MLNCLSTSKISDYLSPDKTLKPDEDRDYLSGIGIHNSRQQENENGGLKKTVER